MPNGVSYKRCPINRIKKWKKMAGKNPCYFTSSRGDEIVFKFTDAPVSGDTMNYYVRLLATTNTMHKNNWDINFPFGDILFLAGLKSAIFKVLSIKDLPLYISYPNVWPDMAKLIKEGYHDKPDRPSTTEPALTPQ
jgi:hypothetical protein